MTNNLTLPEHFTRQVLTRAVLGVILLSVIFFGTAGTLAYWQAWVYMFVLFTPLFGFVAYYLKHDPELLARRMEAREQNTTQKWAVSLGAVAYILALGLPGLDFRFGWSDVPVLVVLLADVVVLLAYGLFIAVMRENRFAARTVRVEAGQQVISSGPYHWVRHPMYVAAILMTVISPLALGSYWAMLPALLITPVLMVRIGNEEKILTAELPGYRDYMAKTKYRLLPWVW